MRRRFTAWTAGLLGATALAVAPGVAQAHDPIAGGSTALKLDRGTAKVLGANGVSVKPVKPAKVKGGKIVFPITGGEVGAGLKSAKIDHSGGLKFSAGGNSLVAKSFQIKVGSRNKLTAKVGEARVPLLKLDLGKAKVTRDGLDTKVAKVNGSLTSLAAGALNDTFGVNLFKRGIPVGTTTSVIKPESVKTTGGDTRLTLDPDAAAALTSLGITPAPIGPASAKPDGSLAFPITGGRLDAKTFAGKVKHSGGISLTQGSTVVELTEFDIQIDSDPDLTALLGGNRVSILDLDLSNLEAGVNKKGVVRLAEVSAGLTQGAADALNAAFGTSAFTAGLTLGTTVTKAKTG